MILTVQKERADKKNTKPTMVSLQVEGGDILSENKKVHKATTKPRTAAFQAGENDVTTGSKDIVSHPKIFQVISCSKQKDKNLDHWNSMPQVSEKCIVEKRNMAEVQDVQVQPVSEHVFYIGPVLVKVSSTAKPKEAAIVTNFRTPPCSWFFVGKNSNSGSTW